MAPPPWYLRARDALLRFWRTQNPRVAAVRDVLVAGGVVLLLLGMIWTYTGQRFPSQAPLVVVESGSMMHGPSSPCLGGLRCGNAFSSPPFGRVGTIDPGDLVLVKDVDALNDVETAFGAADRDGYGGHGDVVVYKRGGSRTETPVIHRAMLLIRVHAEGCTPNEGPNPCRYVIPETCDDESFARFVQAKPGTSNWRAYCEGSPEPITLDLRRGGLFLSLENYPCGSQPCPALYSGFITKGDNNNAQDQPSTYQGESRFGAIACCPVRLDWIVGKARGEIPWFGLIKLALYGNVRYQCGPGEPCSDPTRQAQWTFLRATAPADIWVSLFVAIGVLIAAPIGVDFLVGRVRRAREKESEPPSTARPPPKPPAR